MFERLEEFHKQSAFDEVSPIDVQKRPRHEDGFDVTHPSHSDVQEQATLKTCTAYSVEYVADEDAALRNI
jgi:hypothetical protein